MQSLFNSVQQNKRKKKASKTKQNGTNVHTPQQCVKIVYKERGKIKLQASLFLWKNTPAHNFTGNFSVDPEKSTTIFFVEPDKK
jgi:hypothetical protein